METADHLRAAEEEIHAAIRSVLSDGDETTASHLTTVLRTLETARKACGLVRLAHGGFVTRAQYDAMRGVR